ncbi:MAG TPA: hypothetical protein VFN30_14205 [Chitinophagaceae bacterium]|nr:hypothetical protein [Chitinophagaceae bacterium]
MKKLLLSSIFFVFAIVLNAQFYYNDILGTKKTSELWKLYQSNGITSVTAKSFESDGQPGEGFLLEQKINLVQKTIETISSATSSTRSVLTSFFNDKGELVKTVDENEISNNTSLYKYAEDGKLTAIETNSVSDDKSFSQTEKHFWFYNNKGLPEKMFKIKNEKDTVVVRINYDENENISEEISFARGKQIERYYFYYNEKKQLSDIARYNNLYKRILPDYSFDYDENNRLYEMTVYRVQSTGSDYLSWKYLYNDQGLKIKEGCFDRDKKIVGRIEYQYSR